MNPFLNALQRINGDSEEVNMRTRAVHCIDLFEFCGSFAFSLDQAEQGSHRIGWQCQRSLTRKVSQFGPYDGGELRPDCDKRIYLGANCIPLRLNRFIDALCPSGQLREVGVDQRSQRSYVCLDR